MTCVGSRHSYLNMTTDTVKNLEAFLELREKVIEKKNANAIKLNMAIEKGREIQEYLDVISQSVTAAKKEMDRLQEENNFVMAQTVSVLEENKMPETDGDDDSSGLVDWFASELLTASIAQTANTNPTEALVLKLDESVEESERLSHQMITMAEEYKMNKKMRISINLFDEYGRPIPSCPLLLEEGFRLSDVLESSCGDDPLIKQDLILLSSAVASLLRRKTTSVSITSPSETDQRLITTMYPAETHFSPRPALIPYLDFQQNLSKFLREADPWAIDSEAAFNWIEDQHPAFVRSVTTAVIENSIIRGSDQESRLNGDILKHWSGLLGHFLQENVEYELELLFAVQDLIHQRQHPIGLIQEIFETLYESDVVSKDAFKLWMSVDDPLKSHQGEEAAKSASTFLKGLGLLQ